MNLTAHLASLEARVTAVQGLDIETATALRADLTVLRKYAQSSTTARALEILLADLEELERLERRGAAPVRLSDSDFLAAVKTQGGVNAAARFLRRNPSNVSRRLARLTSVARNAE